MQNNLQITVTSRMELQALATIIVLLNNDIYNMQRPINNHGLEHSLKLEGLISLRNQLQEGLEKLV